MKGEEDPREEGMMRIGTLRHGGENLLTSFEVDSRVHGGLCFIQSLMKLGLVHPWFPLSWIQPIMDSVVLWYFLGGKKKLSGLKIH